ncbi:MAG: oligosaccharide flippase family protein [Gammaproteobacteria bacterium]
MKLWLPTFSANFFIVACGTLSGILAARLLGAEDRGLLGALVFWPHFLAGMVAMGLNEGIVIYTAKFSVTKTIKSTIFALSIFLAILGGVAGFYLMPLLLNESRQDYVLFSKIYLLVFLPFTFLAQNYLALDQGEFKFRRFNIQRGLQAVIYPLLLLVFWLTDTMTVEHAAIAVLAGTAIVALTRVWHVRFSLKKFPSLLEANYLLKMSSRLHVVNILMFLSMQLDKMALILFSTDFELGLYTVAVTVAGTIVSLFVQTFINIMLPTAALFELEKGNFKEVIIPLRRLIGVVLISTILLVLSIQYLIVFVFGNEFAAAGSYAQILLIAFAFVGVKKALVYLLRSWKENRPAIFGESLSTLVLVVGAYSIVTWKGTIGLCVLVAIAHAMGAALVSYFFLRKTGLKLKQFVLFKSNLF